MHETDEAYKTNEISRDNKMSEIRMMSKTYAFLQSCDFFILTTVNGTLPAARPFGAVMELDGALYISTANTKDVYTQLRDNPSIQIVAMKPGTREWIRINGKALEIGDLSVKQAMLDACPILSQHFTTCENTLYALFEITEMTSFLYTADSVVTLH